MRGRGLCPISVRKRYFSIYSIYKSSLVCTRQWRFKLAIAAAWKQTRVFPTAVSPTVWTQVLLNEMPKIVFIQLTLQIWWLPQGMATKQDCWSKVKLHLGTSHRVGFQLICPVALKDFGPRIYKALRRSALPLCRPVGHSLTLWSESWWWCGRHRLRSGGIRDRRDRETDSSFCVRFSLVLAVTADGTQTDGCAKVDGFLGCKILPS